MPCPSNDKMKWSILKRRKSTLEGQIQGWLIGWLATPFGATRNLKINTLRWKKGQ